MGTWIEYRCENRLESSADGPGIKVGDRCFSDDNAGPKDLADDTRASVLEVIRELDEEALNSGWMKTRSGWICPFCVKSMGLAN